MSKASVMKKEKQTRSAREKSKAGVTLRLNAADPSIEQYVARLRSTYGKYATSAEKTRELVSKSMGKRSLTDLLLKMRQEGF